MDKEYFFYVFFDLAPELSAASTDERAALRDAFAAQIARTKGEIAVECYATLGFKAGTAFMLLLRGASTDDIQLFLNRLLLSPAGRVLRVVRTMFGMPGRSTYVSRPSPQEKAVTEGERAPFLIVYPFTKTAEWYLLDMETRKKLMAEHIRVGRAFPSIRQLLLYSFGVDDNEFIVSYETDSLESFRDLVMELRSTEARKYTLNDQPIFTCSHRTLNDLAGFIFTP